jgi:hypothetical protein
MTLQRLREDVFRQPAAPLKVDEAKGVVYGVKALGRESRRGRVYLKEAVEKSYSRYDGAVVNIDHAASSGPEAEMGRLYHSRFGRLKNARTQEGEVFADLHYNPDHPAARSFVWWARNDPSAIGLSHDARCDIRPGPDGRDAVHEIVEVYSVDLVGDPATTRGLFESMPMEPSAATPAPAGGDSATHLGNAILAIVNDTALDPAEKRKKVLAVLKLLDDAPAADGDAGDVTAMESVRRMGTGHGVRLAEAFGRLRESTRLESRRRTCRQLCKESGLPDAAVSDVFVEQLAHARDDAGVKALIEDRRAVASVRTQESAGAGLPPPTSAGPGGAPQISFEQFLAGINGR